MLNQCIVMGRLTRDPEIRTTPSGTNVATFTVACERDYKGQDGEKAADFIEIVAWRNTADFVGKYFSKGRMAVIKGRLETRSYEDKNGVKRKIAEIIADSVYFGDSKPAGEANQQPAQMQQNAFSQMGTAEDIPEIPF